VLTSVGITRIRDGQASQESDAVARESSMALLVDGQTLCRLQCTPAQLEELALGFLCTAGLLARGTGLPALKSGVNESEAWVDVHLGITEQEVSALREGLVAGTGCGLGLFTVKGFDPLDCRRRMDPSFRMSAAALSEVMKAFQTRSGVYRETGGVHSAGIAGGGDLAAFAEDVGRHNAVDKVIGCCLRSGVSLHDKVALTTGRLSYDLVAKCIRADLPVAASRSAATDAAVQLARRANLTLIGFLRANRMNVYSADWRIE